MSGLHCNIQRIVEFQQYRNLVELVHQASKDEHQLQQDMKSSRGVSFSTKSAASGSKFTPRGSASKGMLTPFLGTCPGWQDRVAVRCGLLMRMVADKGEIECD